MTKLPIKSILIWFWIIVSILYIWYDLYSKFKLNIVQNSYQSWINDAVSSLLKESKNEKCQAFDVYSWENKVTLINVDCLQKSDEK